MSPLRSSSTSQRLRLPTPAWDVTELPGNPASIDDNIELLSAVVADIYLNALGIEVLGVRWVEHTIADRLDNSEKQEEARTGACSLHLSKSDDDLGGESGFQYCRGLGGFASLWDFVRVCVPRFSRASASQPWLPKSRPGSIPWPRSAPF